MSSLRAVVRMKIALVALAALAACGQQAPAPAGPPEPPPMPPIPAWSSVAASEIQAPEGVVYTMVDYNGQQVAEISGVPENASPAVRSEGVSIRLPDAFEAQASGQRIRVTVRARAADPGAALGVVYSTADVGNSYWQRFDLTDLPMDYTFEYNVAPAQRGFHDFLGFRNYGAQRVQVIGFKTEVIGPHVAPSPAPAPAQ